MGKKRLTTDEFINRSIEKHGNKFGYSKVIYTSRSDKVIITCKEHGDFLQTATDHLSGCGCKKCYYDLNRYQKQFIEKASNVHGNKFDYSNVEYTGYKSKVIIICPEHGEFIQRCDQHLVGFGCKKCAFNIEDAQNEFISKAKILHNDKYDYSLVEYKNSHTNIKIICPTHGVFEQLPSVHNNSIGEKCPDCTGFKQSNTEEFISKAKKIHGDKFDYSKVNYVNNNEKITIICEVHGEFEQQPFNHLDGHGCNFCKYAKYDKKSFTRKANKIHNNNKYDYSLFNYIDTSTKGIIICPRHGEFQQTPDSHLNAGSGCSKCVNMISSGEMEIVEYIKTIYSGEIITQDRKLIKPKHLDIYLPEINLAIEYNGVYYHSVNFKPERNKTAHINKFLLCKKKNVDLIQIFEDEWKNDIDNVKTYLYNRINNLDTIESNIMNNRFPNNNLYISNGYTEKYISKPLIYPNKYLIYDAGRTVWKKS